MLTIFTTFSLLMFNPTARAQEPYMGEIRLVGFQFCPVGWMDADGRLLPISEYNALFSLFGDTYGGNGRTNFALPDLRGRVPIGQGMAPAQSSYRQGQTGGQESVTLTPQQMPAHGHAVTASQGAGENKAAVSLGSEEGEEALTQAVQQSGESQPHENRPPFLVMRYCVAVKGNYPPRN